MKKKLQDLRDKETPALQEELKAAHRKLFDLRSQAITEKVEDTSQFGKIRTRIAQINTLLKQRQPQAAAK